jgi:hypothetical protein
MAQGGHYAELYNTYFRHQSLDYLAIVKERKDAQKEALQWELVSEKSPADDQVSSYKTVVTTSLKQG